MIEKTQQLHTTISSQLNVDNLPVGVIAEKVHRLINGVGQILTHIKTNYHLTCLMRLNHGIKRENLCTLTFNTSRTNTQNSITSI